MLSILNTRGLFRWSQPAQLTSSENLLLSELVIVAAINVVACLAEHHLALRDLSLEPRIELAISLSQRSGSLQLKATEVIRDVACAVGVI